MKKLKNQWPKFSLQESNAVKNVILSGKVNYFTGNECKKFEKEFAEWSKTKHAIALSNGTVALELALRAININSGDQVIVTPRSFIASVSCVITLGATPIFADIDENSGNITSETIEKVITKKTKAIICVHLGGHPCEMEEIIKLKKKKKVYLIEDCSQAHGAKYKNKMIGSFGDIATWSFCQDKIISTGGEGGMVTTNNTKFYEKMWSYKDHGKSRRKLLNQKVVNDYVWLHDSFGSNFRMTEMQAVLGRLQLKNITKTNTLRNRNANYLKKIFLKYKDFFYVPIVDSYMCHAYYKFYVYINIKNFKRFSTRKNLISKLNKMGVDCFSGSCSEIYKEEAFKNSKFKPNKSLPNAKKIGETSLMFLVHQTITEKEIKITCKKIDQAIKSIIA